MSAKRSRRRSRKVCKKTSKRSVEVTISGTKFQCRIGRKSRMYCRRKGKK